jgi:membrane protease YdiL (CAAX protease family)
MGAIPFGLLHLLNFASGDQIQWNYILGTTLAGLFLSLIFLRHGLMAAILAHYLWNVLASLSVEVFQIPQEVLEGGRGTYSALVVLCIWLSISLRKNPAKGITYPTCSES